MSKKRLAVLESGLMLIFTTKPIVYFFKKKPSFCILYRNEDAVKATSLKKLTLRVKTCSAAL